jgi:hypothetical protein
MSFYQDAIGAGALARAIAFAIEQPADVDINDVVLRPTQQVFRSFQDLLSTSGFNSHKSGRQAGGTTDTPSSKRGALDDRFVILLSGEQQLR